MFAVLPDNVELNPDVRIVDALKAVMDKNGGYCPCRIQHTPETLCPCEEFRNQIADPKFSGYCHCRLYVKH